MLNRLSAPLCTSRAQIYSYSYHGTCAEVFIVLFLLSFFLLYWTSSNFSRCTSQTPWPKFLQNLPWIFRPVTLLVKPLVQFLMLLWFLVRICSPAFFIVQVNKQLKLSCIFMIASYLNKFTSHAIFFSLVSGHRDVSWFFLNGMQFSKGMRQGVS